MMYQGAGLMLGAGPLLCLRFWLPLLAVYLSQLSA